MPRLARNGHSGVSILNRKEKFWLFSFFLCGIFTVSIRANTRRLANQCFELLLVVVLNGQRSVLALTRFCCRWYQTVVARYRMKATWKPLGSVAAAAPTAYSVAMYRFWCAIVCVRESILCFVCNTCKVCVALFACAANRVPILIWLCSYSFAIPFPTANSPRVAPHHSSASPKIIWFFLCRCAPSTPIKCITIWSVRRFLITFSLTLSFFHSLPFYPSLPRAHLSLFRFICGSRNSNTHTENCTKRIMAWVMKYKQPNQMGRKSGIFAAHVASRHFDHQHHRRLFHLLIKHIFVGNANTFGLF